MKKLEINSVEIAKLAGVSRSTVSRVINNYPNVPPKTKEKVMKVIEKYNYVPNASAQVLAGKKTRTIGLFLIKSGPISGNMLSNMLIASVIEHAAELGYHVLTHMIRDSRDSDDIRMAKEIFYQRRIDGGIFFGAWTHEPFLEELISEGFLVGVIDYDVVGRNEPNRILVNFEDENGMEMAVDYLAKQGHRQIGMLNGDMRHLNSPRKYKGFVDAMARRGLPVEERWVEPFVPAETGEASGYAAMKAMIARADKLPTAIVTVNDAFAFGAIRALQESGFRVPEDVSVMGFDDQPLSANFQPPLTTIQVDFNSMMELLTARLIRSIDGQDDMFGTLTVGPKLIVRESCKAI